MFNERVKPLGRCVQQGDSFQLAFVAALVLTDSLLGLYELVADILPRLSTSWLVGAQDVGDLSP